MKKRKTAILIVFFLFIICHFLCAAVSEQNIKTYETLYNLQKDPNNLEYALDCILSTMMYAENNFPSQASAEILLKRVYSKIRFSEQFGVDDRIFKAIIKESTYDLLESLESMKEETDKYIDTYRLLDFISQDFSKLIDNFHFEKFKEYFQLNKLVNFSFIESVSGKQLQLLTSHLIDTIIENNYYLNNNTYHEIVKLGKERFLNYLNIQINPYLDKEDFTTYNQQLSLLKTYVTLYQAYYGLTYLEIIPLEKFNYFSELEAYYNYLSNIEILSRRLLTAEEETLSSLFPVFFDYIKSYQSHNLKTEKLNKAILQMIKNASTRISYEKKDFLSDNSDLSTLTVSNEEINESLKTLFLTLSETKNKEQKKETSIKNIFNHSSIFLFLLTLSLLFIIIFLILPLKTKGTFLKNIGFHVRALSLFEKAAIKHPMDPDIHIKTAQVYEKLGREEEAMNEYKIASKVLDMKEE